MVSVRCLRDSARAHAAPLIINRGSQNFALLAIAAGSLATGRHGWRVAGGRRSNACRSLTVGQYLGIKEGSTVNEAGFDVGVKISPDEAEKLGIKPFGDGGADDSATARLRVYTHGPCASSAASAFIIDCACWRSTAQGDATRQNMADRALATLKKHGFVVLERLLCAEEVAPLEAEAVQYLNTKHEGLMKQPLRANRQQLTLPCRTPWNSDWLIKHELILELVARYVCNNLAGGRTQEEQQSGFVQWLMAGAHLGWFRIAEAMPKPGRLWDFPAQGCSEVGNADEKGPWLGRVMVTKTPPGSPAQKHHRDITLPGPSAQLTIQVALTPLIANNGPLGYVPGSHRMGMPGYEVVANPPLGSVVLYDSFLEHRGIENHTKQNRYAMYYEFETRGMFGGYTEDHFGPRAAEHTYAFRATVDPELRSWVDRSAPA